MNHKYINHEIRVMYADTDQMKIVWHGNYLRYFEAARVELFRTFGMSYKEFEEHGFMLPVKEVFIDYKASAKSDDIIIVKTWVATLKHVSMKIMYEIYIKDSEKLLTKGYTLHPFVTTDGKLSKLPDELYNVLQKGI